MAEIRKHDPDAGEGIGRLVRDALGETIRPVVPGSAGAGAAPSDPVPDEAPTVSSLPGWPADLPKFNF